LICDTEAVSCTREHPASHFKSVSSTLSCGKKKWDHNENKQITMSCLESDSLLMEESQLNHDAN